MELKYKKICVIGMGRSGIAAANFLAGRGATVTLTDQRSEEELKDISPSLHQKIHAVYGDCAPQDNAEMIVLSPGVDIHADFLTAAQSRGTEILSEIELASRFSTTPVIAVTGTNGKTTCTTLIGNILEKAEVKARTGGNIGTPFISFIDQGPVDYLVIEVSSFQLEAVHQFRPRVSVILNITPDHLDRHSTLEHYMALKGRLAAQQTEEDVLILNHDDPLAMEAGKGKRAKKVFFSTKKQLECSVFLRSGVIVARFNEAEEIICRVDELKQPARWQLENILASTAVAKCVNIGKENIADALRDYSGMEHRMEWVRTIHGIDFINDSKGTNVGAVQKSLTTLTQPVILIAGGKDKAGEFEALKKLFKAKVKHLVLIGETKQKFRAILNGSFSYEDAENLEDAVSRSFKKAQAGDAVLLSPACASFDMFDNYEDRGNRFKAIVYDL